MTDDVQAVTTTTTAKPEDDRIAAMVAKQTELLAEAKAAKERLRQFADVYGIDLAKQTPEQIAQTRAAEQRDRERRVSAIERSVTRSLVTSGQKVPESVLDLIMSGAVQSQSIKVDETGVVHGAKEYLDGILGSFIPEVPARPESPQVPRQKLPGADDVEPVYQSVQTFADLLAMGNAHLTAFSQKYPSRYEALRTSHFDALKTPLRPMPPMASMNLHIQK